MTIDNESYQVIERAASRGYITREQVDRLLDELTMFPFNGSIYHLLLKKGLLTQSQILELKEPSRQTSGALPPISGSKFPQATSPSPSPDVHDDFDFDAGHRSEPPRPMDVGITPSTRIESSVTFSGGSRTPTPTPTPKRSIAEALDASRQAMGLGPTSSPSLRPSDGLRPSSSHNLRAATIIQPDTGGINPSPQMTALFKMGRERECSDLHLTVGRAPYLRHQGRLFFLPDPPLTAGVTEALIKSVLKPEQQQQLEEARQLDFSFSVPGLGRYRANVYYQRLGLEGAFRFIPEEVPTLKSLGFPSVLEKLTTYPQGLNLVTGPGGCGKTTTVAAMLEFINSHRHEHIITVEDPVEYVLRPKACQITQREVGTHTNTFADALRTALRQDPDVIMIGELRDLETTSISITAAETGHLVFGTLHTAGAVRTVARILDVYPPSQRQQICLMVAESLRGIISQQLVPRKDGQGRACAMEILVVTTGVSQVIKEGKTHQLVSHMQSGRKLGMKSMDDALMELAQADVISGATAYAFAENKPAFEMMRDRT